MFQLILFITILMISVHQLFATNEEVDKQVNDIYCQLNEFAAMRLNMGETVFPCKDE